MSELDNQSVALKPLTLADLPAVAAIHLAAFPGSALTQLGHEAVRRYYEWQLTGPHQVSAVGAESDGKLVGFYVGGTFKGALEGFLNTNRGYLAGRVLTHPWLLATSPLFRTRLQLATKVFYRRLRRQTAATTAQPAPAPRQPSFGILAIAVDPALQGKGVGQLLMAEADRVARARGFQKMSLTVDAENAQAIRFYQRNGWVDVSQNGAAQRHMEKSLVAE